MTKWKSITTCPYNTPVLVVYNGETQEIVCQFWKDGSWSETYSDDVIDGFTPTHWMPLPAPPGENHDAND